MNRTVKPPKKTGKIIRAAAKRAIKAVQAMSPILCTKDGPNGEVIDISRQQYKTAAK